MDEPSTLLSGSSDKPGSGIAARLELLKSKQAVNAFAQKCGVSESLMRKYLAGSIPGADKLVQLARANGVHIAWLAAGEGPMRPEPPIEGAQVTAYPPANSSEPPMTGTGVPSRLKLQEDFVFVPRYDVSGSMGHGAGVRSGQIVDHLAFKSEWVKFELGAQPKDLMLISAVGDSMEPTLRAGDLLLIDRNAQHIYQDAIYSFSINGDLRVKRIQRLFSGNLLVKSDNERYRQEELTPAQAETLRIIGRVVWAGRRM